MQRLYPGYIKVIRSKDYRLTVRTNPRQRANLFFYAFILSSAYHTTFPLGRVDISAGFKQYYQET